MLETARDPLGLLDDPGGGPHEGRQVVDGEGVGDRVQHILEGRVAHGLLVLAEESGEETQQLRLVQLGHQAVENVQTHPDVVLGPVARLSFRGSVCFRLQPLHLGHGRFYGPPQLADVAEY